MAQTYVEAGHLGGYVAGGDEATYYPNLWSWLVKEQGIKSVLDIGCGEGHSLKYFRQLGCKVCGLEGLPQEDPDIILHDFTTGPWLGETKYDLVWMCEFVEHVEERYIHNIVPALSLGQIVLLTHAWPGQVGYHHVNCREPEYWMGFMAAAGFVFDPEFTRITKEVSAPGTPPWNHYARAGLAFRK